MRFGAKHLSSASVLPMSQSTLGLETTGSVVSEEFIKALSGPVFWLSYISYRFCVQVLPTLGYNFYFMKSFFTCYRSPSSAV